MARKPPVFERQIILARDHRRRYGARIVFRVLHEQHVGALANVSLLFTDGSFGRIRPLDVKRTELGLPFELEWVGFPTAGDAESAGMLAAQAILLTAISLDFGVRLDYSNHEPPTVFDRTISPGMSSSGELVASWPEDVIIKELMDDFAHPLKARRIVLSMELLASSSLEANDRAKFVMAVSALEPLAEQKWLGADVAKFVDRVVQELAAEQSLPSDLRASLGGRLSQLKQESVRQSLIRLCHIWFPNDAGARRDIDEVYALRSQILHDGRVADLDTVLANETRKVRRYLRRIYEQEFGRTFRVSTAA